LIGIALLISSGIYSAPVGIVEESYFVFDSNGAQLRKLKKWENLTFDHLSKKGFEVYGAIGLGKKLVRNGIPHMSIDSIDFMSRSAQGYPSFEEIEAKLKELHEKFPKITQLFSIGKSNQGRDLWVMKLSDDPEKDELEPEVKLISSMHGNEITGRELMIRLLEDLLNLYESDPGIQELINNTEIFIMPSMNPDGSNIPQRGNGRNIDLNRNFPDFSTEDHQNSLEGREIETQSVMKFQEARQFSLSANFHGGAECVNYMWDTIAELHPFNDLIVDIATDYANGVDYLKNSSEFLGGITNGYAWYEVNGGMQDWSYNWYGDVQYTIELSDVKWPNYSEIPGYYDANRSALISFLRRVHQGAGFQLANSGLSGSVRIESLNQKQAKDLGSFRFRNSEFFKVLSPGQYRFFVKPDGDGSVEFSFESLVENKINADGNYTMLSRAAR